MLDVGNEMPEIIAGEMLNYRNGFGVYPSVTGNEIVSAHSDDLSVLIPGQQSPIGKFTFPYELHKEDMPTI